MKMERERRSWRTVKGSSERIEMALETRGGDRLIDWIIDGRDTREISAWQKEECRWSE